MTATRVADVLDDRQVVGDEQVVRLNCFWRSWRRLITCAWIETSSADTGSSQTISSGYGERARDADALPLAARELVGVAAHVVRVETDGLHEGSHAALSPRVLGRPAAAHRHRARPRREPEAHRLRRARLGPRRSIQAQVINLLEDLQKQFNLTYLFIAHDLRSSRTSPPGRGHVPRQDRRDRRRRGPLRNSPHPYTEALLSAVPIPDPRASSASASCGRATSRAPSGRPPGATSTALPSARCRGSAWTRSHHSRGNSGHRVACNFRD